MITNLNKEQTELNNSQAEISQKILSDKFCHRCGGLMISEHCFDVESHTGEFEILTRKCLSCGESIDPTILRNRFQTKEILNSRFPTSVSVFRQPNLAEGTAEDH